MLLNVTGGTLVRTKRARKAGCSIEQRYLLLLLLVEKLYGIKGSYIAAHSRGARSGAAEQRNGRDRLLLVVIAEYVHDEYNARAADG